MCVGKFKSKSFNNTHKENNNLKKHLTHTWQSMVGNKVKNTNLFSKKLLF